VRAIDALAAALILIALVAAVAYLAAPDPSVMGGARVIDGDTIKLDGRTIRLAGMDAPELAQTCGAPAVPECGHAAREAMVRLVAAGDTHCRIVGQDRYRRDLGRCLAGGQDLGGALVRAGLAVAYGGYNREEAEAKLAGRGIWAGPFERPQDWRRNHPRAHFADPGE
jgi:endonuclease YncB( thermonuclease family)